MELQAFAIKKYEKCIELCEAGLKEDASTNELNARGYLAMINSLLLLGEYDSVESHLEVYEKFNYIFIAESAKLTRAIVKARKKEYDLALPMLKKCMEDISEQSRIHVVNELLEVYFELEDMNSIAELLNREKEILEFDPKTPYKHSSLGKYYQYKAAYQIKSGMFDEGVASYLNSMLAYGEISAHEDITKCMNDILSFYASYGRSIDLQSVQKLREVYNVLLKNKIKINEVRC